MSAGERAEFLAWYDTQRSVLFDNRRVLETYCQDEVTVLKQACRVIRREFLQVGNIDVFDRSVTIASVCNKVLRQIFLKPDTIGLIPTGGYSGKVNYSKKVRMWLVYRELLDGCRIMHTRNGRQIRLPELPRLSVDGFCRETNTVYEFCGCYWHGQTCLTYRDVTTGAGNTLAQYYERTMARLEQITQAGYQVEVQWECDFDKMIFAVHPRTNVASRCTDSPLNT